MASESAASEPDDFESDVDRQLAGVARAGVNSDPVSASTRNASVAPIASAAATRWESLSVATIVDSAARAEELDEQQADGAAAVDAGPPAGRNRTEVQGVKRHSQRLQQRRLVVADGVRQRRQAAAPARP